MLFPDGADLPLYSGTPPQVGLCPACTWGTQHSLSKRMGFRSRQGRPLAPYPQICEQAVDTAWISGAQRHTPAISPRYRQKRDDISRYEG